MIMFHKGLWMKEYRQGKLLLWFLPIIGMIMIPIKKGYRIENLRELVKDPDNHLSMLSKAYYLSHDIYPAFFLVLLMFCLSVFYFGFERRGNGQDLTFSLPFSRKSIFITKWSLPFLFLTGTYLLCAFLDIVLLKSSEFATYNATGDLIFQHFLNYLLIVALYSMTVFIGTITGSAILQVLVSVGVYLLPSFLNGVLDTFIYSIFGHKNFMPFQVEHQVYNFTMHFYLPNLIDMYRTLWWVLLPVSLIFFLASTYFYSKNRIENNGKLFVFPVWERVFHVGVTICAGLLLASLSNKFFIFSTFNHSRIYYLSMFVLGLLISHFLMEFLVRRRLNI